MSNQIKKWDLLFAMPNLKIETPIEYEKLAIVPSTDDRLKRIKKECLASKVLLTKFYNQFSKRIQPSALIIDHEAPLHYKSLETIINFRNIVAISSVIKGFYNFVNLNQSLDTMFSNYFDLYPIMPSVGGNNLVINTPTVLGIDDYRNFRGQISPQIIYINNNSDIDKDLLSALLRMLKKHSKKASRKGRAAFRSIQIAYQASTIFKENNSLESDIGSRINSWVSAFETLAHPGGNNQIGVWDVIRLLGKYCYKNPKLKYKKFRYKKKPVNLTQKLYGQLYEARNAFTHGNKIKNIHRYPYGDTSKKSLLTFAPFLYKAALLSSITKEKSYDNKSYIKNYSEFTNFQNIILKCYEFRK